MKEGKDNTQREILETVCQVHVWQTETCAASGTARQADKAVHQEAREEDRAATIDYLLGDYAIDFFFN